MRTLPFLLLLAACGGDASPVHPDAAVDASTVDIPFPCEGASCDKTTQYCYETSAGLFQADGCTALPAACNGQATCACITPTLTDCFGYLACSEHDGEVTAECMLP